MKIRDEAKEKVINDMLESGSFAQIMSCLMNYSVDNIEDLKKRIAALEERLSE